MVRYYGRAKTRVGSVNTNQLGLKMSGCPSKIGKQGALVRYQSRRAKCNQKFIGPVYYQGQMWTWNNTGVERAPRNQSFNSGVGHINAPRFGCAPSCSTDLTYEQALKILFAYFEKLNLQPALFAKRETLQGDLNHPISKKLGSITHYETGSANFNSLPASVQKAILVFNNIKYRANVKGLGNNLVHVIGSITYPAGLKLLNNGFGTLVFVSKNYSIRAYGNGTSGYLHCNEVKRNQLCGANPVGTAGCCPSSFGGDCTWTSGYNCYAPCSPGKLANKGRCFFNNGGQDGCPNQYFQCDCS